MENKVSKDTLQNNRLPDDLNNEVLFDLLKISLGAQQKLAEDFGKGCTLWIIVIGIMVNCVYNKNTPFLAHLVISILGILMCILAVFANSKTESIRKGIAADIDSIYKKLNMSPLFDSSRKLSYVTKICTIIDVVIAAIFIAGFFI